MRHIQLQEIVRRGVGLEILMGMYMLECDPPHTPFLWQLEKFSGFHLT
jgi:hypothetical protein